VSQQWKRCIWTLVVTLGVLSAFAGSKGIDPDLLAKAQAGDAQAQFNLGYFYQEGQGVHRDYDQARNWYRKAAEQGFSNAQLNLGMLYFEGHGVHRDYSQAAIWFRKAAEKGNADGQFNLAGMYVDGEGVPQDYAEAIAWFRKAAEQGHERAQAALGVLYQVLADPINFYCSSQGSPPNMFRILHVVLNYIRNNPDTAYLPPAPLVVAALRQAFPCEKK